MTTEQLKVQVQQIRRDILRMVNAVNSGHPGGSLGCAEFFAALYGKLMTYDAKNFQMDGKNEDIFFLSNGHISPVFYSTLARNGFFPVSELATFRHIDSRLQGHPTNHDGLPGVRISSGSLGQGISVAIGAAIAKKLNQDSKLVYVLTGDGELQEGQIWEALMYAPFNKIDNLILTIDLNHRQIDGDTDEILSLGNLKNKLTDFGWEVLEVEDGNSLEEILNVYENAKTLTHKGKSIAVLLHTEMGNGVDFMMGSNAWHGKAPNDEQLAEALIQNPETELTDY